MSDLATLPLGALTAPSPALLDHLVQADALIRSCPQVDIVTEHVLHGGMYARTIRRGPGVVARPTRPRATG